MQAFRYHSDILARFPNIVGGVILAQGMANGPTTDALRELFLAEQRATLARIGTTPLSEIATLSGWRSAFRAFGVDPTQYRSAAEALLRRLTKKGDIPSINLLVDLCNLISIRYALPVAVFDCRALQGAITVRFADGSERFTPLFETLVEHPEPGEVVFCDDTGLVIARRWCWRQADQSAARPETRDAVITIEANHPGGRGEIEAGLRDLIQLLSDHAGGDFVTGILGAERAEISR